MIIGIDFSLNSPGICFFEKNNYYFISVIRKKITKKEKEIINKMRCESVELIDSILLNLIKSEGKNNINNIFDTDRYKILDCIFYINYIIKLIDNKIKDSKVRSLIIGVEGLSFMSVSSSAFDIAGYSYYLRIRLLELLQSYGYDESNLYVIPPSIIKKHAGKGNFKKIDMLNSLIQLEKPEFEFKNFCFQNYNDIIEEKNNKINVIGVVSDLVDSFFIVDYLEKKYNNNN